MEILIKNARAYKISTEIPITGTGNIAIKFNAHEFAGTYGTEIQLPLNEETRKQIDAFKNKLVNIKITIEEA